MNTPDISGYEDEMNLNTKSNGLHDEDSVGEDSSNFFHTGEILDGIPDVPVFIQQLELA